MNLDNYFASVLRGLARLLGREMGRIFEPVLPWLIPAAVFVLAIYFSLWAYPEGSFDRIYAFAHGSSNPTLFVLGALGFSAFVFWGLAGIKSALLDPLSRAGGWVETDKPDGVGTRDPKRSDLLLALGYTLLFGGLVIGLVALLWGSPMLYALIFVTLALFMGLDLAGVGKPHEAVRQRRDSMP